MCTQQIGMDSHPHSGCSTIYLLLPWWRHDIEVMSVLLAFCEGNPLDMETLSVFLALCEGNPLDMETLSVFLALCEGNPPVTGGFPSQRASNAELKCLLWCQPQQTVEQTVHLQWLTPLRSCAIMWCLYIMLSTDLWQSAVNMSWSFWSMHTLNMLNPINQVNWSIYQYPSI